MKNEVGHPKVIKSKKIKKKKASDVKKTKYGTP